MKDLQTSGRHDVKPRGERGSRSINHRFSLPLPYSTAFPPDLTAVVDPWPKLPEAVRAGIVATVKAATGK